VTDTIEIVISTMDLDATTDFWSAALDYRVVRSRPPYRVLAAPAQCRAPVLLLQEVATAEDEGIHLDLRRDDPAATFRMLSDLGAQPVAEVTEVGRSWTVMRDPRDITFCICAARDPEELNDGSTPSTGGEAA
jgi:catechol 2,3-dioxygenase-like lactoylglutathione lyase family enzyme